MGTTVGNGARWVAGRAGLAAWALALLALITSSCSPQAPETTAAASPRQAPSAPPLFQDHISTATFAEQAFSKRHQFVDLHAEALNTLSHGNGRVTLALPGRGLFTLVLTSREENPVATITHGTLEGLPESRVTLTTVDDKLSGRVLLADGSLFQITPTPDGVHCIFEVDRALVDMACEPPAGKQPASIRDEKGNAVPVAYQLARWRSLADRARLLALPVLAASSGPANRAALRGTQRGQQGGSSPTNRPASGKSVSSKKGSGTAKGGTSSPGGNPLPGAGITSTTNTTSTAASVPKGGVTKTPSTAGGAPKAGGSTSGAGASIDIYMFYTPAVAKAKGGDSGAKAFAASGVADVNEAFANSGIKAKLNLVGVQLYQHTEAADLGADLGKFNGDEAVKSLRDQKKADLVSLLVDGPDSGAAGVGALLLSAEGNPAAYCSVVVYKHVLTNHTLAHELGHNLGSNHCWDQGGDGVFGHSHGHRWTGTDGKNYRSIMSYSKDGDMRTGQFSNPAVKHQGAATGDAQKADNARTFGATAGPVSQYR